MRLSLPRPPLRAVILILVAWIGLRAWSLWPGEVGAAPERAADVVPAPPPVAGTPLARPAQTLSADAARSIGSQAAEPVTTVMTTKTVSPPALPDAPFATERRVGEMTVPTLNSQTPTATVSILPPRTEPSPATTSSPAASRWSGWAYLFARPGSGRTLAAGGQLGGSQAAARLTYRLTGRLSLAARAYAPLNAKGAEAALGVDLRLAGPLHAIVERRIGIDRQGRDAWSAYATAGVYRERGALVVDAYGQAGVVGTQRRDVFVDGAMRAGLRVGGRGPVIGAGAWGAAQPGARRLDIGPRIAWREPRSGLTASIEGRFRVAGKARPGSGVALTLARDF